MFDKDNTLSLAFVDELHESVVDTMEKANKLFPGRVAILSNSVGSCDDKDYAGKSPGLLVLLVCCHKCC